MNSTNTVDGLFLAAILMYFMIENILSVKFGSLFDFLKLQSTLKVNTSH